MEPNSPTEDTHEELIQKLLRRYEQILRQSLTDGPQTLEQIEREVAEISREIDKITQEEKLSRAGTGDAGRHLLCSEGHCAVRSGLYQKQLTTLHGKITLQRTYYYCPDCKKGFCPLDRVLGLGAEELSLGMQALVTRLSCYMPGRTAATEADLLTGVAVSHSTIQRVATSAGQQVARDWQRKEQLLWQERLPGPDYAVAQLQSTLDGVMIYVGKRWREAKVGVAYERAEGKGVERSAHYASLAPAADFGRRWRTLNHVMGAGKCQKVGVVADGAEWIWKEVGKYHPGSVQALDFTHGVDHLWKVANARFGEHTKEAAAWIEQQKQRLMEDGIALVISDIRCWRPSVQAKKEIRRIELAYLQTHAHRMLYKTLKEAGYHIGSGAVESACKSTVQARLKGPGMHWSETGAEAMLHLRATWCTSQLTDFADICRRGAVAA